MSPWWAEYAWLGGDRVATGVLIETEGDRIARVTPDVATPPTAARRLPGVTVPGLVNAHSHAFHRALRGRTQAHRGTFWTWRERMYEVAASLSPASYYRLARATFAEMVLAGITTVGEFHYLHHDTDGVPYPEPTAMAEAVVRAARDVGIRLTLLDTCYLVGGFAAAGGGTAHVPLAGTQRRFGDATATAWAARATRTHRRLTDPTTRVGAAVHSARAVPAADLPTVARWAAEHGDAPLHVHLSEQPLENDDCVRVYGATPTRHLASHGVLGARTTAVHATHLTDADLDQLGAAGSTACLCVTTERDLADGIGPTAALVARGVPLALGTDSQAVVDLLEEARGVELGVRVVSGRRGNLRAADLLDVATARGAAALGWDDLGTLSAGAAADFVNLRLDSVRTAGTSAETALEAVVFAAGAPDVSTVVVGGRTVVDGARHTGLADVAGELAQVISEVTGDEEVVRP